MPADPAKPRHLAMTFLAGLVLALLVYAELLAPGSLATDQDAFHYFLAQRIRLAETIGTADVFWEPAVDCGRPFFADPTVLAAYPGHLILFIVQPILAGKLLLLLHVALAATTAAAYARSFKLEPLPAALAGLLYAASGPVLSHSWSPMWIYGLAWLPLAMALTRAILVEKRRRASPGLGAAVAMMILAGAYELLLAYAAYATLELTLSLIRERGQGEARASWIGAGALAGAAALSLALSAVQLLPTAELFAYGSRSGGLGLKESALWSLPWARLPELGLPALFGSPGERSLDLALVASRPAERAPFLGGIYLGSAALALALLGLLRAPRRPRWLLVSLIVLPVILSLGTATPLFRLARALVPGFALFRYPEKIFSLVALPIAVLAGFGYHALFEDETEGRRRALKAALGAAGLAVLGLAMVFLARGPLLALLERRLLVVRSASSSPAVLNTAAWSLAWTAGVTALTAAFLAALPRARRPLLLALLVLVVLDPAWCNRGLQRRGPRDGLLRRPATLPEPAILGARTGPERIATLRPARGVRIVPQHASLLGFQSADAYGSIRLQVRQRFDDAFKGSQERRLALQSVGLALAPLPGREAVYHPMMLEARKIEAPPRLALIGRARVIADDAEAGAALGSESFSLTPAQELILAEPGPAMPDSALEGQIFSVKRSAARIELEFEASRPCFLRINDSDYPGWQARIDGESAPILRADLCFRAVPLPAGRHRVVLEYTPRGFWFGLALTMLGALASLALWRFSSPLSDRRAMKIVSDETRAP